MLLHPTARLGHYFVNDLRRASDVGGRIKADVEQETDRAPGRLARPGLRPPPGLGQHVGEQRAFLEREATGTGLQRAVPHQTLHAVLAELLKVLLVGGGSVIVPKIIAGISEVIQPPFHSVANAVGAAISKVGGTVDIIQSTGTLPHCLPR